MLNTQDLNSSRKEALQGLLGSLSNNPTTDATLSAEQLCELSEKISDILGDGADRSSTQGDQPSPLQNEDGDPIVDISEPVYEGHQTNIASSPVSEQELIPFATLPPDEKERWRRERDRILDLLDEEERLQQLQEERDAEEGRKEAIRKRRESSKAELERLKATRDLQKKMGQALVRHAKGSGELEITQEQDARSRPRDTSPLVKKTVSFADVPVAVTADEKDRRTSTHLSAQWGDVTLGRLRAPTRIPLVSTADAQKFPMKMHVVERHPTATFTSTFHNAGDSDDESFSTGSPSSEMISPDHEDKSSSGNDDLSDDEPLEEEFDYDVAQHHREIALEYHKKRQTVSLETAQAMAMHTLDDYEQEKTSNGHLPLSHFRADRMTAGYNKSHGRMGPIEQPVDAAPRHKSLRKSVRLGKLENAQLVGGDSGESGSEEETIREVIHMLQTGNSQNLGPDVESSPVSTFTTHQNSDVVGSLTIRTSTTNHGLKSSGFKSARGESGTFHDDESRENVRLQSAISGVFERKAPRPSPGQHFPINKPSRSLVKTAEPVPQADPMIIDSPPLPTTPRPSSAGIPPSSSACPAIVDFLPPHQTQSDPLPVDQSRTSPRDPASLERPISRFMAKRKGIID